MDGSGTVGAGSMSRWAIYLFIAVGAYLVYLAEKYGRRPGVISYWPFPWRSTWLGMLLFYTGVAIAFIPMILLLLKFLESIGVPIAT
jgi:hypothetical protein